LAPQRLAPVAPGDNSGLVEERSLVSKRSDDNSLRSAGQSRKITSSGGGGGGGGNDYGKKEKMPVIVGILTVILFILGGAVLFAVWEGAFQSIIYNNLVGEIKAKLPS